MARIVYEANWSEIGKVEATYQEKTKTSLTLYKVGGENVIVIIVEDSMQSLFCGSIMSKLWPPLKAKNCTYIGLSTVYKTNFSTFDGSYTIDSDLALPFRYFKSSHSQVFDEPLKKASKYGEHIQVCNQINATGGLTAAFLMHAEMYGQAAIGLKMIVD